MPGEKRRFGLSAALTTPVAPDGTVDLARFASHARAVQAAGCDGVTPFGSTGEGAALALADRERMLQALVDAGVPPAAMHAGVAAVGHEDAVAQGRMALDVGAAGLLVAPPFYFKGVGDEGLYAWFARLIEALGPAARGIVLYHIPPVTAVPLSPALVGRLKRAFRGVVVGVKDSSGSWADADAFLAEHRDLAILVGDERLLARAVRHGAEGAISGLANLVPGLMRPLVDRGEGDPRIDALVEAVVARPVIAAIKALVGRLHGDEGFGPMLPPLVALSDRERADLFAAVDAALGSASPFPDAGRG